MVLAAYGGIIGLDGLWALTVRPRQEWSLVLCDQALIGRRPW